MILTVDRDKVYCWACSLGVHVHARHGDGAAWLLAPSLHDPYEDGDFLLLQAMPSAPAQGSWVSWSTRAHSCFSTPFSFAAAD